MKVRIKFAKEGNMKFIGHLDVMRYFQKAMRRAHIDIAYTEGFSPHMVMSFAAPLGVGLTSIGEYLDIEVRTPISSAQAVRQLNAVMAEGFRVLSFRQIEEGKSSKAMSLVAAADYRVTLRPGSEPCEDWLNAWQAFLAQEHIVVTKKTKTGEAEVDIRPMILEAQNTGDGQIFLKLSTGSSANLKPDLVIDAYAAFAGISLKPFSLLVHRCEVYAAGESGGFVSLESLGEEIAG